MLACVCLRAAVRNCSPGRLDWLNPAHEKIFIVILISIAILILDRPNSQFPIVIWALPIWSRGRRAPLDDEPIDAERAEDSFRKCGEPWVGPACQPAALP